MRLPWLLTLLMAVLCATVLLSGKETRHKSRADLARARDEAAEFRERYFSSQAQLADVDSERASTAATLQQLATHVSQKAAADLDQKAKQDEQQKLMDDLRKRIDAKEGEVSSGAGVVTVRLADEILFPSGEAELSKHGKEVLGRLGDVLKPLTDKQILVGGHTDDAPIHTARFPSNWELSTARAVDVVHFLVDQVGVDPRKLTAAGYSQYHSRGMDRAHDRRIEILLIPQLAAPAPNATAPAPATTTTAPAAPTTPPATPAAK
ncbi:MAG TPA: OmpA family protein [Polyangia bacterium]|jgi:chemotaxis protein MotB|nr:OmpA family protein [Polyangia bacterium]